MNMATAATGASKAPEFIIMLREGQAGLLPPKLRENQSVRQRNLTNTNQVVANLTPARVAELKKQGFVLHANQTVSVPKPVGPVEEVALSAVAPQMKVTVPTHGADKLHEKGITGKGVTVCVIDTGIENHKDLGGRIIKFYDVFDKAEEAPNDGHGHGTHCAGIVGAAGGVLGMAPDCDFIGIKVLDDRGSGSWASVMAGIDKAMDYFKAGHNPMTISMSLGGGAQKVETDPVVAKVREALALGIQFSIAAGNSGSRSNTIGSPGTTPEAITVAASDTRGTVTQDDDIIAYFSSRGGNRAETGQVGKPDIAANGVKVLSLGKRNGYAKMSGTSMACPAVAGAVALLQGMAKDLADQGKLTVAINDIDYSAMIYKTANNRPKVPDEDEGAGLLRIDLAADLLVKTYGTAEISGAPTAPIYDRDQRFKFEDGKWTIDKAASFKANELAAAQAALAAGTMDKFKASKGKGFGRRFLAFVHDIVEAPVKGAEALKDKADAQAYKLSN